MKKGLLLTLVMVAIALSGYRAMGRAPVVNEIRDIVVGDADTATPPNTFVYPDVINLNDYVNDPDGAKADIVWSYYEPTGKYIINGVPSQDSEDAQQIISPLLEKRIAGPGVTALDPLDSDSQSITITVRNKDLSPLVGDNIDPGAAGLVPDSARVITLFASDGSTVGLTKDTTDTLPSFIAYTVKGDTDHTSPISHKIPWRTWDFSGTTNNGWTTSKEFTNGTVTFTTSANGICLEVTAAGQNGGEWQGNYGEAGFGIELVKNSVWRCRLTASSQGTVAGEIPLWMFLYDNANTAAEQTAGRFGANGYGGEFVFLDTSTSENGAGVTPGRTDFECWLSPMPVQAAAWNADTVGPFDPACDAYNDMRLRFRVFDLAVGVPGATVAHGQICLAQVQVDRYDLIDMKRGTVAYEDAKIQTPAWRVIGSATSATNDTASGGGVTVAPILNGSRGWLTGTVQLVPGDGVLDFVTPSVDQDDFPVIWESNTLYCVEAVLSCPSAPAPGPGSTEAQGDIIRMGMDGPTNEIAYMNLVDNAFNCSGTPKATPDTFTTFFYSHTASLSGTEFARLRPRFDILNTGAHGANGATMGTKYHSVKVTKVSFD